MGRRFELIFIVVVVTSIVAITSNVLIAWLRIETKTGAYWAVGPATSNTMVFVAGSSLAGDALSWHEISRIFNVRFEGWGVAGSSPSEWERYQHWKKPSSVTVLVVSPYDLNEYFLCDFRAEVVPFVQTVKDLWEGGTTWSLSRRMLSQYPLAYLRWLFPTIGRSQGVMVGFREKLRYLVSSTPLLKPDLVPTFQMDQTVSFKKERISEWDAGRMLRRIAATRSGCMGIHDFHGPKRLAFLRMLGKAASQGRVIVVVLPVSPAYTEEFLSTDVKLRFEALLNEAQSSFPTVHLVRLDHINRLHSNDYFWDLVHMNKYGRTIATQAFLSQMINLHTLS